MQGAVLEPSLGPYDASPVLGSGHSTPARLPSLPSCLPPRTSAPLVPTSPRSSEQKPILCRVPKSPWEKKQWGGGLSREAPAPRRGAPAVAAVRAAQGPVHCPQCPVVPQDASRLPIHTQRHPSPGHSVLLCHQPLLSCFLGNRRGIFFPSRIICLFLSF